MRLNVGTMLPAFAVVEDAAHHNSKRADALCEGLKDGDVLLADRAYVDLRFLHGLSEHGVFFVLREKENMAFEALENSNTRIPASSSTRPCSCPGKARRKSIPRRCVASPPSSKWTGTT